MAWTDEERQVARTMLYDGATFAQVATALGKTRSSIAGFARRKNLLGVSPRSKSKRTKQAAPTQVSTQTKEAKLTPPVDNDPGHDVSWPDTAKELWELESNECKWPYGTSPYRFCGNQTKHGSSYCQHHYEESVDGTQGSHRKSKNRVDFKPSLLWRTRA